MNAGTGSQGAVIDAVSGICPIAVVPFDSGGQLDLGGFEQVLNHLITSRSRAVTLFGLASEFHKLQDAERERLLAIFVATLSGSEVTSIASVTAHSWEVAVRVAQAYQDAGVQIINVLPPFFLSPTVEAILEHLERICESVTVPVMFQYAPGFTGSHIPAHAIAQVAARHQNLRYAKVETQPPTAYIESLVRESTGRVRPLIGYQGLFFPQAVEAGCVGIQPGSAVPEVYVEMWAAWTDGRHQAALAIYQQILPYMTYWMQNLEFAVAVEKVILQQRGIIRTAYCRAPTWALSRRDGRMIADFIELAAVLAAADDQHQQVVRMAGT